MRLTLDPRSIANDRPVEIYITDNDEPDFSIPKSILDNLSDALAESFAPADRKDPQESPIELRLPEDHEDAWNILIYWAYKHRLLPAGETSEYVASRGEAWVAAWLLAERNGLSELQDLIMLELLNWVATECFGLDIFEHVFQVTLPGSKIRLLVLEELMVDMHEGDTQLSDVEEVWSCAGFMDEFFEVAGNWDKNADHFQYFDCGRRWKEFMVAGGPSKHPYFDDE